MFTKGITGKLQEISTPFYFYDLNVLEETLKAVTSEASKYGYKIHYALKANANHKILELIKNYGLGADCVSGNEVLRAIECGFPANEVVYAGVGKSDKEINDALDNNIFCFNCESVEEIKIIDELAAQKDKKARIALRINPNVDAHTHKYITTGLEENKFGINEWEFPSMVELVKKLPNIELIGLHFHIGSQITNFEAFKTLCTRVDEIQTWFENNGITLPNINLGGGLGIDYDNADKLMPDFPEYFKIFNENLKVRHGQQIHFEPGRSIVGKCGDLITKVLYIKKGRKRNFAIVDAGMTDLLRPALYHATHQIENIISDKNTETYDIVGPICESSDVFAEGVKLPETNRGDLLAIRSAGAYGEVMASQYNLRDMIKAVYSDEI